MKDFRAMLCRTRSAFPQYSVTVRRARVPNNSFGECVKMDDGSFKIIVLNTLLCDTAVMVLIHEWAHVLAWDAPEDHGPEWGVAYSRIYKIWLDYCLEMTTV